MISARGTKRAPVGGRRWERYSQIKDLSLTYEGQTEGIPVRPLDISPAGMFINTPRRFPEGAVLQVCFRLTLTNVEIATRCEVRYCLPGVGVGVEFIGIPPEAQQAIAREMRRKGRRRIQR